MPPAIVIDQLRKDYGTVPALCGVSLAIAAGEFFGLLGPNGAGKTTLINCLVGLVRPSAGRVLVLGEDVARNPLATKAAIGFAPQQVNIEIFFPIQRLMEFQGGYFGLSRRESARRAEALLRRFGLWEKRAVQHYRLSGGMQKRLMIARALMAAPRVLILDEPTAGVDVEQRHELWAVLRELRARGTTILLTTHYIDEAEILCDRVGIIHQGALAELAPPRELIAKYCERRVLVDLSHPIHADELQGVAGELQLDHGGCRISARPPAGRDGRLGELVESLLARIAAVPERRVCDLHVAGGDLEEVFLKVTGTAMRGEAA